MRIWNVEALKNKNNRIKSKRLMGYKTRQLHKTKSYLKQNKSYLIIIIIIILIIILITTTTKILK